MSFVLLSHFFGLECHFALEKSSGVLFQVLPELDIVLDKSTIGSVLEAEGT